MSSVGRRVATLLLAFPLLAAAFAAPAQAAPPNPVAAAAGWLTTQFVDGTHLPAPSGDHFDSKYGSAYYPNYGENADVLFALAAAKAGASKAKVALRYLDAHLADYADPSGAFGGPFDGSIAKLALAHLVTGTSAVSLLKMLKADECPAGATKCTPGAPANIFASASDAFVLLAEARAGGTYAPSAAAIDYFLSLQCANGGFTTDPKPCGSGAADIDATSYALMALQALGGHASEVAQAADWLQAQRKPAGYWVVQGVANTNSTGLAAAALAGAGRNVSTSQSWLLAQRIGAGQPGAGAFRYAGTFTPTTTSATSPSVIATAQGILGLVNGGSLATVSAAGSRTGVNLLAPVVTASHAPVAAGGTVLVHGAGFAAGEHVVASLGSGSASVGEAAVGANALVAITVRLPASTSAGSARVIVTGQSSGLSAATTIPVTGSPTLANTGVDASRLLAAGLASVAGGLVLLVIGRRRETHVA